MAYCNNCGSENDDYADFCGKCGTKIQPIAQEQPVKGFQEPAQGYQEPAKGFQEPAQGYQEPAQGYQEPAQGYQEPAKGFQEPAQGFQQPPQGYQQGYSPGVYNTRTGWLTFVIVVNWIGIVLGGVAGLFFLILFPPFGVVIFIFVAIGIWIVRGLAKYNNTARIISIVLSVLGGLSNLSSGDFIGLIIAGLIVYALAFDKATVALFQQPYPDQPGAPMQRY